MNTTYFIMVIAILETPSPQLVIQSSNHFTRLDRKNARHANLPCGNLLHSYGKSPFLMEKLTINGDFP